MEVLRVNMEENDASSLFTRSLKKTGFAVLCNHPIDKQLIKDVYHEWQGFFVSDKKEQYHFHKESQDGFFPASVSETAKGCSQKDIKEFFQYYPWGQFPDFLSNKTSMLYKQLNQLTSYLLNWVEADLPTSIATKLSMPLSQMIENTKKTMLRILHYPPFAGVEPKGAVRAAAHGDINLLTLLVGATEQGLQVQDSKGLWHDVPTDMDSIAVNIGDMLQMCSQDYFKSTLHRVINPNETGLQNCSRMSMPFFLHPANQVKLSEKYTAESFLLERLKELGVK